jgi:hypothetical protein
MVIFFHFIGFCPTLKGFKNQVDENNLIFKTIWPLESSSKVFKIYVKLFLICCYFWTLQDVAWLPIWRMRLSVKLLKVFDQVVFYSFFCISQKGGKKAFKNFSYIVRSILLCGDEVLDFRSISLTSLSQAFKPLKYDVMAILKPLEIEKSNILLWRKHTSNFDTISS